MADKNINDRETWSRFVRKLRSDTLAERIHWQALSPTTAKAQTVVGNIYRSEILPDRFVDVFRYEYTDYGDIEFGPERFREVMVEFVDSDGNFQWRVPQVPERSSLMDAIEHSAADIDQILEDYLSGDE